MAGIYADGFDENGQWEASMANLALENNGAIVDIGQVPAWMRKQLDRRAKEGVLVKYRGHWNTLLTFAGMGRPDKTIWAYPAIAEAAGVKVAA
jgi:hypothetical protein